MTVNDQALSPYLLERPPTSSGRVLLATALAQFCALSWGLSDQDIAAALNQEGGGHEDIVRREVRIATDLLGTALVDGALPSFARPIGGGEPVPLAATLWEIDDFAPRFASSAIAMQAPFDAKAQPTHWIFVGRESLNAILEAVCNDVPKPHRRANTSGPAVADVTARTQTEMPDRMLRLPDVERLVCMSRSTIYSRIASGRFPEKVPMQGNISRWRESDITAWLTDPR